MSLLSSIGELPDDVVLYPDLRNCIVDWYVNNPTQFINPQTRSIITVLQNTYNPGETEPVAYVARITPPSAEEYGLVIGPSDFITANKVLRASVACDAVISVPETEEAALENLCTTFLEAMYYQDTFKAGTDNAARILGSMALADILGAQDPRYKNLVLIGLRDPEDEGLDVMPVALFAADLILPKKNRPSLIGGPDLRAANTTSASRFVSTYRSVL